MILVSRSSPSHDLFSFPKFVIFILAWVYHNGRRKTIAYLKRLHILQWHMQNMQYQLQNVQHYMQNMQYQTKLSPSYPQSYPQKGVNPCKMCSTTCKIYSTPCKICSTKQSYPQVIPRVIPKKVLTTAKCAVPPAKYAVPTAKYAVPSAKYAVSNKVIPKLSPELSPMDQSQKNRLEK